jgi:MFS superfamily sulfate permease-like transporter
VLEGETVPFIDLTAAQMLETLAEDLERDGIQFILARDVGQVHDILRRQESDQPIAIRTYPTVDAAVTAALQVEATTAAKA